MRDAAYWIVFGSISLVHRVLTVDRECCPPSLPAAQVVRACYTDTDIRVKIRPPACRNLCLLAPRRVPIGLVSDSQQKSGSNRMHVCNHLLVCTVLPDPFPVLPLVLGGRVPAAPALPPQR